jgi:hypothetical protein
MESSFKLGRIAGIEVGIHYTWLFAFALVAWSLAVGFFPAYYPTWSATTYWILGLEASGLRTYIPQKGLGQSCSCPRAPIT